MTPTLAEPSGALAPYRLLTRSGDGLTSRHEDPVQEVSENEQRRSRPAASARAASTTSNRDEIGRFAAEGALSHVHVATSRERPGHRGYVRDRIREQSALVWRLLAADAYVYVYVCGSAPMREAVRAAFADVVAEHTELPRERAEAYLDQLETTTRYRPDLWA